MVYTYPVVSQKENKKIFWTFLNKEYTTPWGCGRLVPSPTCLPKASFLMGLKQTKKTTYFFCIGWKCEHILRKKKKTTKPKKQTKKKNNRNFDLFKANTSLPPGGETAFFQVPSAD